MGVGSMPSIPSGNGEFIPIHSVNWILQKRQNHSHKGLRKHNSYGLETKNNNLSRPLNFLYILISLTTMITLCWYLYPPTTIPPLPPKAPTSTNHYFTISPSPQPLFALSLSFSYINCITLPVLSPVGNQIIRFPLMNSSPIPWIRQSSLGPTKWRICNQSF